MILNRVVSFFVFKKSESLYQRFLRYLDESHRDGVMGNGRYAVALGKAHKLMRFLTIEGHPDIATRKFTTDMLLRFRQFIYDEYKYARQYPDPVQDPDRKRYLFPESERSYRKIISCMPKTIHICN